ncbi:MAG: LAGLIDADG family homing endonuclease [Candidatus Heimdallarchaeota archaeon]|nr:LAGLIDADG family homing endonuclease [Candidatus Heimdallarchaeota archaeon]
MLHWLNDPFLLDKTPTKMNDWETANTLIEQEKLKCVINEDLSFANLYGIMVRKIDFVREKKSDRIIARFPFLVLTDELKDQIQTKILLIAEAARDYFYRSINKSILAWRDVLADYLERGTIPVPLFRCAQEVIPDLQLPVRNNRLSFTSARGEAFTFPSCITKSLAYLCGVCNGDGNLRKYWVIIVDETKEHIENLSNMLGDLFGKKGHKMQDNGAWVLKLNLLWATRLFNFITDQTINAPKYDSLRESLLFQQLGAPYRNLYWRGVFDSDGSFKNHLCFASTSVSFAQDFHSFLKSITIRSRLTTRPDVITQLDIPSRYKWSFAEQVGSSHLKKMQDFFAFLSCAYHQWVFTGINKKALTINGEYFNFELLSKLQVIGLDSYLKDVILSHDQKLLPRFSKGKGITIQTLSRLCHQLGITEQIMNILAQNEHDLLYRSANSHPIKLPLAPSEELQLLMESLQPTARGATIITNDNTDKITELIQRLFLVPLIKSKYIKSKLIRKFLLLYGNYSLHKNTNTNVTDEQRKSLMNRWHDDLIDFK